MGTIALTGSAGGIGAATRARLERAGHRVVGVDVRDAEVIADLATADGRAAMVAGVRDRCGGGLDGVVAGAGVMGDAAAVSVNFFGAVATLEGLRPLLARAAHPRAVAISSNSTTTQPGLVASIVDACLADDEERARALAEAHPGNGYAASKLALARWVRRRAVTAEWIGAGVNLNAVAPGVVATPMTEDMMDFVFGIPDVFPVPIGRPGVADEVAALLEYLLSPDAGFFVGSVVFMDGGTDAAVRADDWPVGRG
jgi:NAD(P)-dependent dehydrogenase (short-subunit alcohol dehydrogenase family)